MIYLFFCLDYCLFHLHYFDQRFSFLRTLFIKNWSRKWFLWANIRQIKFLLVDFFNYTLWSRLKIRLLTKIINFNFSLQSGDRILNCLFIRRWRCFFIFLYFLRTLFLWQVAHRIHKCGSSSHGVLMWDHYIYWCTRFFIRKSILIDI